MNSNRQRRSMLPGFGAALAAFALRPTSAQSQSAAGAQPFQPARHTQDEWMGTLPGKHRTVIDCAAATASGTGVFYANNIFTANRNGYQLANSDVAVIVVLRHEATTFAYNDAIWAKYGSVLANLGKITDPKTNQPPVVNPLDSREFGPADQPWGHGDDSRQSRRALRALRRGDQPHRLRCQVDAARDL